MTLQEESVLDTVVEAVEVPFSYMPYLYREVHYLGNGPGGELGAWEVPENLRDLLERFSGELNLEEGSQLSDLLTKFQDVFACVHLPE